MPSLDSFYNDGFGWTCRQCELELTREAGGSRSRLLSEGEAEQRSPLLTAPVAKWADAARSTLLCPRCGITELVERS